jgi:hypothetical protein
MKFNHPTGTHKKRIQENSSAFVTLFPFILMKIKKVQIFPFDSIKQNEIKY